MTEQTWTTEDSNDLYQIRGWGDGYFGILPKGELCVYPQKEGANKPAISIPEIITEMKEKGIQFPAVIRFQDVLRSQVSNINKVFKKSIEEAQYQGKYYGVFPIKVNQMREVIEEIVDAGSPYDYGLEAGSKSELMAVLAMNHNQNALTILNGYKDREYLKLAILGSKMGRKMVVVIEKITELYELIEIGEKEGTYPIIGLRAKLSTKGSGKWADSTGERAKFGLTIPEVLDAVEYLKEKNLISYLNLFHFHIGSQIPNIKTIKAALTEAARVYAKLIKIGAPIQYLDVGGGLGINYDGSNTSTQSSTNYSLEEYASDVVYIIKDICNQEDVEHPHIVTESGRAVSAHHSCVVTKVFGKIKNGIGHSKTAKTSGEHHLVTGMREVMESCNLDNFRETYFDAIQKKEECTSGFNLGILSLEDRAKIELMYWQTMRKIHPFAKMDESPFPEIEDLEKGLAEQYLCNFSVFQSTADMWAIKQVLPIVPIKFLDQKPEINCTLADITCDSDGKIDHFLGSEACTNSVKFHDIEKINEDYMFGIFLTGAYQDIMGDFHNLFGRLNEVHVFLDDDDPSDFYIEEVIKGNTSWDVLKIMQYNPEFMAATIKMNIDKQVKRGKIKPREGVELTDFYEKCLNSYTYLN